MYRFNSLLKLTRKNISAQELINRTPKKPTFTYKDISQYPVDTIDKNLQFLKQLNYTDSHMFYLRRENPYVFTDDRSKSVMTLEEWYQFSEKQFGFNKLNQQEILLNVPHVVQYPAEFYEQRVIYLADLLGISKKESLEVMTKYPKAFFEPKVSIQNRYQILMTLLNDDTQLVNQLLKKHTFVLGIDERVLKANFYKLIDYGFTAPDVLHIAMVYPLFLLRNVGNLLMNFKMLENMSLSRRQIIQLVKTNPYIFSLDYSRVLVPKIQLLKDNRFSYELQGEMFYKYPWLITKSINSFKAKIRYLTRNHNIDMIESPYGVTLLNYNYENFLKPRGDMMLKKGYKDWQKIMKLTDNEFCKELGASLDDLTKAKSSDAYKKEIDIAKYKELKVITKSLWNSYLDHPML